MSSYNNLYQLMPLLASDKRHEFIENSATPKRNCITASLNMPYPWIWPNYKGYVDDGNPYTIVGYWPKHLPVGDYSLSNFLEMYKLFGFEQTDNDEYEKGFWKNVIYGHNENDITHAAHLLKDGRCVSKLGEGPMLVHMPKSIICPTYGDIITYVKRLLPIDKNEFKRIILTT